MRVLVLLALLFSFDALATGNSSQPRQEQEQGQGQHQGQAQGQGQTANSGGNTFTSGDTIDYDVAANKALMVTSGCQIGSAADGVEFGITVIKQSPACLLLRSSSDALMFAATLRCQSFEEAVLKGTRSTTDTACLRLRSQLVHQAVSEREQAVAILTRDAKEGFVKKLWNKIW